MKFRGMGGKKKGILVCVTSDIFRRLRIFAAWRVGELGADSLLEFAREEFRN